MSSHNQPPLLPAWFTRYIAAVAVLGIAFMAYTILRGQTERANATAGYVGLDVSGLRALDEQGDTVALATTRTRYVFVVAENCPHCHRLLEELRAALGEVRLSQVTVLAVEGVEATRRTVNQHGPTGVRVVGPLDIEALVSALHLTATPLILEVDASGLVLSTELGYPGPERVRAIAAALSD